MIDVKRQTTFKGQYKQFAISLMMSSEDTLSIVVENTENLEKYSCAINREYILQQEPFFQSIFEGAKDVYDCLKDSFSQILIEGEFILLDYRHEDNNRVRRISIQLFSEATDRIEFSHLNADKMKKHFTAQLLQKDNEIQELKQKYEDIVQRHSTEIQ
jgi:hypothetical protein